MTRRAALLFSSAVSLAGCTQTYDVKPIRQNAIAAVVAEIKREVGEYQTASKYYKDNPGKDQVLQNFLKALPKDNNGNIIYACGQGKINFFISKVKMELTTTADNTTQGGLGVTIPITVGSIGPTFDTSKENAANQKLDFTAYPVQPKPTDAAVNFDANKLGPIAQTLLNLRGALVQSSVVGPCFTPKPGLPGRGNPPFSETLPADSPLRNLRAALGRAPAIPIPAPAKPKPAAPADGKKDTDSNSIALGITVTKVTDESVKITAAVVAANIGGTEKSISGNTITVTFDPTAD